MTMNRRDFFSTTMTGLAGAAAASFFRTPAWAEEPSPATAATTVIKATTRSLDINGKAASVYGLVQRNGTPGLTMNAGDNFDVALHNELPDPTLIHWHGLLPPWPMDGVPDTPAPLLKSGEARGYLFRVADGGTYWMHAHTLQEQNLLAAPLIVHDPKDTGEEDREVVILLHDFSFTPAEELLARLTKGGSKSGMSMGGMGNDGMAELMAGMSHNDVMKHMAQMRGTMEGMRPVGMTGRMDLNDIDYDAYLANDRTLDDPEVIRVEAPDHVRLRIINGAAATNFTIDTGLLHGELIAVDGQDVAPVGGAMFPIAMGQRLDIRLAVPKEGGAFPVLALREGGLERTGIVLASANAKVAKLAVKGASKGPVVTLGLETLLRATHPLVAKPVDRSRDALLTGNMASYSWEVQNGDIHSIKTGERIEITMHNLSMMMHPMHLHGHHFQVVGINGNPVRGAVRDTVAVPPMSTVTIAFDANNPGKWAFHCHHLYHMASGMMAFVQYLS